MASEMEQKIGWCLTNADECERLAASGHDERAAVIFRDHGMKTPRGSINALRATLRRMGADVIRSDCFRSLFMPPAALLTQLAEVGDSVPRPWPADTRRASCQLPEGMHD
jgi:hypothetical protein